MGSLTQAHIRAALAKPGKHHDGDGLLLAVRESGQASWVAGFSKTANGASSGLEAYAQ
ncbi:hypothetical protein [Sphingopyxis sp.]|uniref:hypothetical protein n=1 Tax=Sphingopyxis sp. TaxID=1908224 RepID=UPI0025E8C825|nr:hypothetical protein [Sphingopyxis sp.]